MASKWDREDVFDMRLETRSPAPKSSFMELVGETTASEFKCP